MAYDFQFENNAPLVREQFEACLKRALTAIGMQAESYAKQSINQADAIDTGRMINSVTYGTAERAGGHEDQQEALQDASAGDQPVSGRQNYFAGSRLTEP